jgi:hypothetical protein
MKISVLTFRGETHDIIEVVAGEDNLVFTVREAERLRDKLVETLGQGRKAEAINDNT